MTITCKHRSPVKLNVKDRQADKRDENGQTWHAALDTPLPKPPETKNVERRREAGRGYRMKQIDTRLLMLLQEGIVLFD
jgi:hypothetical protein